MNIDSVVEKKLEAAAAHVSQFEPSIRRYRPDWDPAALDKLKGAMRARIAKKDGHYVEAFRAATGFSNSAGRLASFVGLSDRLAFGICSA